MCLLDHHSITPFSCTIREGGFEISKNLVLSTPSTTYASTGGRICAERNHVGRANFLDTSTLCGVPFDGTISVYSSVIHLNGSLIFAHLIKKIYFSEIFIK